jgi:dihydroflavonol-4-reductase
MKAVVIGASGHIGNAVVRALLERGYEITACGRRRSPPRNLAGLPVRYLPGDAEEPAHLDRWIAGQDLVVDAAAPYPVEALNFAADLNEDPIATAERRTRRLLDAVARHNAILAYVGSFVTLVRPQSGAHKLRAQVMRLAHPYFEVKELIESQILHAARGGIRCVLVNPTMCLGPWDLRDRASCIVPLLLCGEVAASVDQVLNVIDVRDVAAALLAALDAERYAAPLLVSGHQISTSGLYSLVCERGGGRPPRFSTPAPLALMASYWMEMALAMVGRATPLPAGALIIPTAFDYLTPATEMIELGVTPRPLSETLAEAIRWYREIGYC